MQEQRDRCLFATTNTVALPVTTPVATAPPLLNQEGSRAKQELPSSVEEGLAR
jgi:hypothetical protein